MSNEQTIPGVRFNAGKNKWVAQLTVHHKNIHLGYFDDKIDAIIVRLGFEIRLERGELKC
jgi:hypothetical protein